MEMFYNDLKDQASKIINYEKKELGGKLWQSFVHLEQKHIHFQ